jgi:gluconate 2-dehydrogenase alpha chain
LRIITDDRGDATGVEYLGPGGISFQPASVVILASYTFENVRVLLLSRSQSFPNGLGNNAGQVGRYYMARQTPSVSGVFEGRRLNRFTGPSAQGQTIDDFNADNFDHTDLGFIRGGRITAPNNFPPIVNSSVVPPDVPRWGRPYKAFLGRCYNSIATLMVDSETLPYDANFLELDPEVRDPLGVPVVRITFDIYDNERHALTFLQDRAGQLLTSMGADRIWRTPLSVHAFSTHDVGGTRMGTDPSRSVVDSFGRIHDAPNVFILGGSTFPTHGGLNPTLTMQALALRSAKHIARTGPEIYRLNS